MLLDTTYEPFFNLVQYDLVRAKQPAGVMSSFASFRQCWDEIYAGIIIQLSLVKLPWR